MLSGRTLQRTKICDETVVKGCFDISQVFRNIRILFSIIKYCSNNLGLNVYHCCQLSLEFKMYFVYTLYVTQIVL